jgi:hypothetical protein
MNIAILCSTSTYLDRFITSRSEKRCVFLSSIDVKVLPENLKEILKEIRFEYD